MHHEYTRCAEMFNKIFLKFQKKNFVLKKIVGKPNRQEIAKFTRWNFEPFKNRKVKPKKKLNRR